MADSALKTSILDAMKEAMRARDKVRLGTIRLIQADIKKVEVDERIELDDARIIAILDKMVKQRRESIKQYEAADRGELAAAEQAEIEVIQEFLPSAMSEDELNAVINQAISDTGASSMKDMGAVMNLVRPQVMGRADMGQVSGQVKKLLG